MLCCSISRVRVRGIQAGGGRSAARCCGLFSCLYAWRGSAGDWPPVAVPCPASRCARLRDLKGMRACLAAARLRLYPDSAAAAAPPGRARSAGSPVAPGCSPLRLRGCCASLRPRSPLRSAAPPLRSFPAAPWVAALPSRSLGGAVAVARRAWAAAPPGPAPRRALLPAPLPRGGCAAAWPVAALPPGGRLVGVPPPRVLARCGAGVAAAAGKEKAGLAAGFPGKRRIRTPFSCR